MGDDVPVVLLDVVDDATLAEVGRLVWQGRGAGLASAAGLQRNAAATQVGLALAELMRRLLNQVPALRRIVVAGGDSAGAVASALGRAALCIEAGLAPGAPLCRAWSDQPQRDGLQVVLKGGQMGAADFFGAVRRGRV